MCSYSSDSEETCGFLIRIHARVRCMGYDQVWGQDGWILAKFFFCVFMDRDDVEVHKLEKKKNEANIQPSWPNKLCQ